MRADDVTLAPEAEELRFHRVGVQASRSMARRKNFIERRSQPFAGRPAIGGQILVAVGDPEIRDHGLAKLPAGFRGDAPASDPVVDPVLTHRPVPMRKCETIRGQWMAEKRRIEIEARVPCALHQSIQPWKWATV